MGITARGSHQLELILVCLIRFTVGWNTFWSSILFYHAYTISRDIYGAFILSVSSWITSWNRMSMYHTIVPYNPLLISFKFKTWILELKANKALIIFFFEKINKWVNMANTGTIYANTTSERLWPHCAILSLYQLKSRDNRWGRLFQLRNRSFCHYLNKCKIYKFDRKQTMNFLLSCGKSGEKAWLSKFPSL